MFVQVVLTFLTVFFLFTSSLLSAPPFEVPSSFNPVGSGARALAMGGAYMSACSDGTGASWNPACLCLLKDSEFAIMGSFLHRKEDNSFSQNQVLNNVGRISEWDLNYVGAVIPFKRCERNMVISFNYQQLYEMNREWDFINILSDIDHWKYRQSGTLSAIELAYGIQLNPRLSFGITCNFWDNSMSENKWKQTYHRRNAGSLPSEFYREEQYSFKGHNFNIGLLYKIKYNLFAGAIIKTPFQATIDYEMELASILYLAKTYRNTDNESETYHIDMPLSYGFGMIYLFSDQLRVSADLYCTRWDQFILTDEQGKEYFPITKAPTNEVDIDPTVQVRMGAEYLWQYKDYFIPVRGGVFYDPVPGDKSPDDFWGFTLGTGLTKNHQFSIDIAYQFRKGNDIQAADLSHLGFSQDVYEHSLFFSLIYYWKANFWDVTSEK